MWRIFVLACCVGAERQLARPRVYHGQEDTNQEFPFVVSMQRRDGSRVCTCNLIAENWLLTSGHRIKSGSKNRIIKYADITLKKTTAYSEIIKVFHHPGYFYNKKIASSLVNNLALVLIEKVPNKIIVKLSAIDYGALLGLPVKFAAFGKTASDKLSKKIVAEDDLRSLQVGEGVVVKCTPSYPMFGPSICVAPKCSNKFQDTRRGDAGGPVMYMGKLIGILIAGESDEPISVVAPISPNLIWISDMIKKNS